MILAQMYTKYTAVIQVARMEIIDEISTVIKVVE